MLEAVILINFAFDKELKCMLDIKDLSLSYDGREVLRAFSLHVERGEVVCLCGESGCGKSSLLRAVLGFVSVSGEISVGGKVLAEDTVGEIRRQIAYLPQELALPYETVAEMVEAPFLLKANRSMRFSNELLWEDWKVLGLNTALYDKRVAEISGGERQRIMLSVAGLLGKPLLLADEPTSALDAESVERVGEYFRMLAVERDTTVVVVSHSEKFAEGCDRVVRI